MKLDTHLIHLVTQYIVADGDIEEQSRLQQVAIEYLMKRQERNKFVHVSLIEAINKWAHLIGILSIE